MSLLPIYDLKCSIIPKNDTFYRSCNKSNDKKSIGNSDYIWCGDLKIAKIYYKKNINKRIIKLKSKRNIKLIDFTKENYEILKKCNPPLFKDYEEYEEHYNNIKNNSPDSKWIQNFPETSILDIVFPNGRFRCSYAATDRFFVKWIEDLTKEFEIDGINIKGLKTIIGENWHDEIMIFKFKDCVQLENLTYEEKTEIDD